MVCKNKITVELVDANTKKPFMEHEDIENEKVYVEVEPGVNYFVRVKNDAGYPILFDIYVDECHIGYVKEITNGAENCGLLSRKNGTRTMSSLKFKKLDQNPWSTNSDNTSSSPSSQTGTIKVEAYYGIDPQLQHANESAPTWREQSSNVSVHATDDKKKNLKSDYGNFSENTTYNPTHIFYTKGNLVHTFDLMYCTTVGLIDVGVLKKRPAWENARLTSPYKKQKHDEIKIEPTLIKLTTMRSDGQTLEEKTVEEFDLTTGE